MALITSALFMSIVLAVFTVALSTSSHLSPNGISGLRTPASGGDKGAPSWQKAN
jgi:hypothetical protein